MSLPSYNEIAIVVGIDIPPPTHRVTRSGIRKYLMAAAQERHLTPITAPGWFKLWSQIEWTRMMAKAIRVTIPPKLWDEERARLAAKIAQPRFPAFLDEPELDKEKERALRWTRKRSRPS